MPDMTDPEEEAQSSGQQHLLHVLSGHSNSVRAIAAAYNTLISGSYDCSVRVWNIETGSCVHTLRGHREKVYSVAYSHEIKRAASGSLDATVKVWCTETGNQLFNLEGEISLAFHSCLIPLGHTSLVGLIDLSPSHLVSAAADGQLRVWSPITGQCLATLLGHGAPITCFDFDAKLNRFVSGSDGGVKVWELDSFAYASPETAYLSSQPPFVQTPNGKEAVFGRMIMDCLNSVVGVWRVSMNERRLVCSVQKEHTGTWFEVFDFGAFDELGTSCDGPGDGEPGVIELLEDEEMEDMNDETPEEVTLDEHEEIPIPPPIDRTFQFPPELNNPPPSLFNSTGESNGSVFADLQLLSRNSVLDNPRARRHVELRRRLDENQEDGGQGPSGSNRSN